MYFSGVVMCVCLSACLGCKLLPNVLTYTLIDMIMSSKSEEQSKVGEMAHTVRKCISHSRLGLSTSKGYGYQTLVKKLSSRIQSGLKVRTPLFFASNFVKSYRFLKTFHCWKE